jgi:hypothetical protein
MEAIVMKKRSLMVALFLALGAGIAATYIFPPHPVLTGKFAH